MPSTQAKPNVLVLVRRSHKGDAKPTVFSSLVNLPATSVEQRFYLTRLRLTKDNRQSFRSLCGNDRTHARSNDRRLFNGYTFERATQVLFMIECNLSDGHDPGISSSGGIESSTEARLEDTQLDLCLSKGQQGNRSNLLKKSWQRFK